MIQVDPPNITNSQQNASGDLAIQALPQGATRAPGGISTLEPELEISTVEKGMPVWSDINDAQKTQPWTSNI